MIANRELTDGLKQGLLAGMAVLVLVLPQARPPVWREALEAPSPAASTAPMPPEGARAQAPAPPGGQADAAPPMPRRLDLGRERPSRDVRRVAQWVVDSADNGGRHFVILDKRRARVYVFEPGGKLAGASPVLLGYAAGDDTVPGIGEKPIEAVRPQERTTPAGRFVAERGRNARQEDVVWIDYDAAVSMHRVVTDNPVERRLQRLASPTWRDNRISYGCINLPPRFFEKVLWPRFKQRAGVVYVLPEKKPLTQVFPGVARSLQLARKQALSGLDVSGV